MAVINTDDAYGLELAASLEGKMPVIRFGFNVHCDFRANNFRQNPRGMEFELAAKGKTFLVRAPLIGRFNVYNLLAALAAANACGIRPREAVAALANAPQVPGRMENVGNAGGATVFVDYAHTPDALENACRTLKELDPRRLITVFGCGGDRDTGKRPLMAAAAARHSDACVITSDNPRSEDPLAIIREIEAGMGGKGHLSHPRPRRGDLLRREKLPLRRYHPDRRQRPRNHPAVRRPHDRFRRPQTRVQSPARTRPSHCRKPMKPSNRPADRGNPRHVTSPREIPTRSRPAAFPPTPARCRRGSVFFALRGENFDGDAFAESALRLRVRRWSSSTSGKAMLPRMPR